MKCAYAFSIHRSHWSMQPSLIFPLWVKLHVHPGLCVSNIHLIIHDPNGSHLRPPHFHHIRSRWERNSGTWCPQPTWWGSGQSLARGLSFRWVLGKLITGEVRWLTFSCHVGLSTSGAHNGLETDQQKSPRPFRLCAPLTHVSATHLDWKCEQYSQRNRGMSGARSCPSRHVAFPCHISSPWTEVTMLTTTEAAGNRQPVKSCPGLFWAMPRSERSGFTSSISGDPEWSIFFKNNDI